MRTQNREFYSIILPTVTEKLKHDSWHKDWDKHMEVIRKINKFPDILITKESSIVLKRAMYKLALYFKREFNYDYIQYDIHSKNKYIGYMWTEEDVIVGGCLFWWADRDDCWRILPDGMQSLLQWGGFDSVTISWNKDSKWGDCAGYARKL